MHSTLTNKIKDNLFIVFGSLINQIDNKAKPNEVIAWKDLKKTKDCYKKLFKDLEDNLGDTYMTRILSKLWPDGKTSQERIAFAISVCQTILNSNNKNISISDPAEIRKLMAKNLVSFYLYFYL